MSCFFLVKCRILQVSGFLHIPEEIPEETVSFQINTLVIPSPIGLHKAFSRKKVYSS